MAPTRRKKKAVIPFKPDYDETEIEYIKHRRSEYNNGITEEISERVPKLPSDATPYLILTFFSTFAHVRETMQWTTGVKLFQRFRIQLMTVHLETWLIQVNGVNQTVANFDANLEEFKAQLLRGYKYHNQMDFLRTMKKPPEMSPSKFLLAFRASEGHARQLPDAPGVGAGFSDIERRRCLYNAMPIAWTEKFDDANMVIEDETIEDMRSYFDLQHEKDPFVSRNSNNSNSTNNNSNNNNNSGNRNNRSNQRSGQGDQQGRRNNGRNNNRNPRGGRGNNNGNNNGNYSNQGNRRIQNSDPCPLPGHQNHTWGECRTNRYNNESQRNRGQYQGGNRSNNGGANRNAQRGDAHATEQRSNRSDSNQSPDTNTSQGNPNQGDGYYTESYFLQSMEYCAPCTQPDPESFFLNGSDETAFEREAFEASSDDKSPSITEPDVDYVPSALAIVKQVNDMKCNRLLRSLFDHGGSHVMVKKSSLGPDAEIFPLPHATGFDTIAGSMQTRGYVYLKNIVLPEFSFSRRIKSVKAYVFDDDNCKYDCLFGRSFLNSCKIDVCSSDLTCKWYGLSVPFHRPDFFEDKRLIREILTVPSSRTANLEKESYAAAAVTQTKDTFASVEEVAMSQTHLSSKQQAELLDVLKKFPRLFDGSLGRYPKRKFHIALKPDSKPYHCKGPYSVAYQNLEVLKHELNRQVELDILARVGESEWGMPMMVIPKKDGAIRTIDDMRELNKCILRKCYPLPKIQDIFHRRIGYKYVSIIDLTLCYYTYELDDESSWLCVLVTPFGKYRRKRLPMGLSQSPDWAQAAIEEAFLEADLLRECVEAYIDDVGTFSNSWEHHLLHLEKTLRCLETNGYTVNPAKCQWGVQEVEWLGHLLTPKGIKPLPKKIKGVLQLSPPTNVTELRSFLGMINYYRDFWKRRSHILAPLTALTGFPKGKRLPWNEECEQAFRKIKAILIEEVLLYYPDPNKTFYIEPDASIKQLGATIYQLDGSTKLPVAFFSRKLSPAQTRYPASDLEALCITEVFEEYRSILYGSQIVVRTDHKNLTQRDLKSRRLLHWRLLLEEFSPQFVYLPGPQNVVADALSRLPMTPIDEEKEDNDPDHSSSLHEALLFYPDDVDTFPLQFESIAETQQQDPAMLPLADRDDFDIEMFNGVEMICRRVENQWKIVLPQALVLPAIKWYHVVLGHCGVNRLVDTLRTHFWIPNLKSQVADFVGKCDACQRNKFQGPGYGKVPPRNQVAQPWEEVAVDLVGPWTVELPLGEIRLHALTMIDTVTNLAELVRIENKTAQHVAMQFTNHWLSRYPKPQRCIHDQGTEFTGINFQSMLATNAIKSVPISVRNPRANSIVERVHKTMQDMLNISLRDPPANIENALDLVDSCLAAVNRAFRASHHLSLGASPGSLVFQRDMMLPIPLLADWNLIRERRQVTIDENNRRENLRRRFRDYVAGDLVLVVEKATGKLRPKTFGPFTIESVHVNGTITIQRAPGIVERLSIRRVRPYTAPAAVEQP